MAALMLLCSLSLPLSRRGIGGLGGSGSMQLHVLSLARTSLARRAAYALLGLRLKRHGPVIQHQAQQLHQGLVRLPGLRPRLSRHSKAKAM